MEDMFAAGFFGILVGLIVFAIFGSIAALILWACAKGIGKIENANFGNAWLVVLFASISGLILGFLMGAMNLNMWLFVNLGLVMSMIFNAILSAVLYVVGGKLIWACEWDQSVKAYSVIFVLHIVLIIAAASWLNSVLGGL